jgi:hypothetical protein
VVEHKDEAWLRAVNWIHEKLGPVRDLPKEVVEVIWVNVFRSMEVGIESEGKKGPRGLTKDLIGGGDLMWRFASAMRRLEFILKMVPIIRSHSSEREILDDSQLLVDILKWGIIDGADMSWWQRLRARQSADADPMYRQPVPDSIL